MTAATREQRIERLRAGRARVAAEGGRLGGAAPYGWGPVPSATLVEVPGEQAVIWLIGHLNRAGWPLRRIAEQLNDLAIPAPRAERWAHPTVHSILVRSGAREAAPD